MCSHCEQYAFCSDSCARECNSSFHVCTQSQSPQFRIPYQFRLDDSPLVFKVMALMKSRGLHKMEHFHHLWMLSHGTHGASNRLPHELLSDEMLEHDYQLTADRLQDSHFTRNVFCCIYDKIVLNGFSLSEEHCGSSALYVTSAYLNHSCDPNALYRIEPDTHGDRVFIASIRPIEKGEQIFISYVSRNLGKTERQLSLSKYGFVCNCSRCKAE